MPFIGLGLHVLIALFFAVHVVRTGKDMYWLMILFMFPLLGSIVYFFAIYLPDSRLQHSVRKTVSAAAKSLDPGRDLREAQRAFELTPTAQNQMRLAEAFLESGDAAKAVEHYEACLNGPFATDPEIRIGAARALLLNERAAPAAGLLEAMRNANPDYRAEIVTLLLAQAYGRLGRTTEARTEFESAVSRFGSIDAKAEYAIWALTSGDHTIAQRLRDDIAESMKHWNKHHRALNKPILARLEAAFANAR